MRFLLNALVSHKIILLFLLFLPVRISAQINTDRPDQSDGVDVVGKRKIQIETGFDYSSLQGEKEYLHNTMFRYGFTDKLEGRIIVEESLTPDSEFSLNPIVLSAKYQLFEGSGYMPGLTLVGYLQMPSFGPKFSFMERCIKLAFSQEITDNIGLNGTVGYLQTSGNADDIPYVLTGGVESGKPAGEINRKNKIDHCLVVTLATGFAITDRLSSYVEYFPEITKTNTSHHADIGLLYLINDRVQFDMACGANIADIKEKYFFTFGLSFALNGPK